MAELDWGSVKSGGSGEATPFLRLEAGTNQIRVVGRPYQVSIHWENALDGTKRKIVCLGAGCPLCKKGKVPMQRFQVLAINRKTNKVEILEGGPKIFGEIKQYAVDPEYGDPTKYDFKIKKEGSGRETKYSVIPSPKKSDLTAEESSMVETSKSLEDINKPKTIEELYTMGLEALSDSIADLEDDLVKTGSNKEKASSSGSSLEINDDDWDNL
jgi:hypothetical protein